MNHTKAEGVPPCAQPGRLIGGKYRVGATLGRGGMGVVVGATHAELGHQVAIKLLLVPELAKQEALARFTREAQAAAKIRSHYVVRVQDIGRLEDGTPYMVMEHLDGCDLEQHLRRSGAVSVQEAALHILQTCDALAQAHALGIVHRDLKPANLFLARDRDGQRKVKVLDFGISKFLPEKNAGADLTQTSSLMGSPRYMSPEQMQSAKSVDVRADVWALGAILYELLSGKPAFDGNTLPEVCSAVVLSDPPPLRQLRPEVPEPIAELVARCLCKQADSRPADVVQVATALAPFAGSLGPGVLAGIVANRSDERPATAREVASSQAAASAVLKTAPGWTRSISQRRTGRLALLAGVMAIGGALWITTQSRAPQAIAPNSGATSRGDLQPMAPGRSAPPVSRPSATVSPTVAPVPTPPPALGHAGAPRAARSAEAPSGRSAPPKPDRPSRPVKGRRPPSARTESPSARTESPSTVARKSAAKAKETARRPPPPDPVPSSPRPAMLAPPTQNPLDIQLK